MIDRREILELAAKAQSACYEKIMFLADARRHLKCHENFAEIGYLKEERVSECF